MKTIRALPLALALLAPAAHAQYAYDYAPMTGDALESDPLCAYQPPAWVRHVERSVAPAGVG